MDNIEDKLEKGSKDITFNLFPNLERHYTINDLGFTKRK